MKQFFTTLLLTTLSLLTVKAQDVRAVLAAIEQGNTQLRALHETQAAEIADREAENVLGPTSLEYSPFFHRGINGLASSELILSQEFDFPTLYGERRRSVALQQNVLDLQYRTLRRDILLEASRLCCDLITAQKTILLVSQRMAATDSLLSLYARRLELGHATAIDVNRIKLDRMNLTTERAECQSTIATIHEELTRLNGGAPITALSSFDASQLALAAPDCFMLPAADPQNLLSLPPSVLAQTGLQTDADIVAGESLEMATAEAALSAARHELQLSKKSWYPTFTVGFRRNTEIREANAGFLVGVAFPLFSNGKKQKAARLHQSAAQYELANACAEAESRQRRLAGEARSLACTLATYDVPLMQQTLSLLLRAVYAGELSIIDYYTEAERVYGMLQQRISTEGEYLKAIVDLNRDHL